VIDRACFFRENAGSIIGLKLPGDVFCVLVSYSETGKNYPCHKQKVTKDSVNHRQKHIILQKEEKREHSDMKRLLRTLILVLVRLVGWPGIIRANSRARRMTEARPRILLVRPDHLGDLILC
jgi:hypothetical protein